MIGNGENKMNFSGREPACKPLPTAGRDYMQAVGKLLAQASAFCAQTTGWFGRPWRIPLSWILQLSYPPPM